MPNWEHLITPAVVSTVITAVLAPFLFYVLKRRDENRKRNFEVRYAEYKKYLAILEEVARATRADFETQFMQVAEESFRKLLTDTDDSHQALINLRNAMSDLGRKMREAFSKSTSELHGLRLVCSDKLLVLVNDFVRIQEELLDESINMMTRAKTMATSNPDTVVTGEMKKKGAEAETLFEQILKQMRKELKIIGS